MTSAVEPNASPQSSLLQGTVDLRDSFGQVTALRSTTWTPADPLALPAVSRAPRARTLTVAGLVVLDIAVLLVAMAVAFRLRNLLPGDNANPTRVQHTQLALASLPIWVAVLSYYGLYARQLISTRLDDFRRIGHAVGASVIASMAIAFVAQWDIARSWLIMTFVVALGALTLEREVVRRMIQFARRNGHLLNSLVIIGTNDEGRMLSDQFFDTPELGYEVAGLVDATAPIAPMNRLLDRRDRGAQLVSEVLEVVERTGAGRVLIARTAVDAETTNRLTRALTHAGVPVEITSSLSDIDAERLTVQPLGRFATVAVQPVRSGGWRAVAKRSFDLFGSLLVLTIVAPIVIVVAGAVKLTSRGPLLFSHDRVGLNGRRFKLYKIRSMVPGAEHMVIDLRDQNEADGPLFKMENDPRVTPVGRILRSLSLDEIPQLWNVLRGEMSLVGPRPALPS